MNKLTAAISTICLGAAGFSGAAVAGVCSGQVFLATE